MSEQETDIGGSQADLAGNARDEIDDLSQEHAEEGHAINLADDIRALVSAREQRVREESLDVYKRIAREQVAQEDAHGALVRDAVAAERVRATCSLCQCTIERGMCESCHQNLLEDAVSAKDERIAELEQCNVALGHEKELALADAYRENERLRASLSEAQGVIATLSANVNADRSEILTLRADVNDYAVQRNVNVELRSEVGRLHSLLERANALLPPDDPVNVEIEKEFEGCTETIEKLRATNEALRREMELGLAQAGHTNEELRSELDEEASSRDRMSSLLHQTANALKGVPNDPLRMHWWSDLPDFAEKLKAENAELKRALDEGETFEGLLMQCQTLRIELATARRDAREMARAIGRALDESQNGSFSTITTPTTWTKVSDGRS
jgi:hypothetical protein